MGWGSECSCTGSVQVGSEHVIPELKARNLNLNGRENRVPYLSSGDERRSSLPSSRRI